VGFLNTEMVYYLDSILGHESGGIGTFRLSDFRFPGYRGNYPVMLFEEIDLRVQLLWSELIPLSLPEVHPVRQLCN